MATDRDREGELMKIGSVDLLKAPLQTTEAKSPWPEHNPPFKSELTVIWAEEKAELLRRIEALEVKVNALIQAFSE